MYYITVDGGGTKLNAILFDDTFKMLAAVTTGGVNATSTPPEQVKRNIRECADRLLADRPGIEIEELFTTGFAGDLADYLNETAVVKKVTFTFEPIGGLFAGDLTDTGFLALSGTGSDVFKIVGGKVAASVGGWGSILGDYGSGVWIGEHAMRAAIRAEEGWDEPTALLPLLRERYDIPDGSLWPLVSKFYASQSPFREAGQFVPLAAKAAAAGDAVAEGIFKEAARLLAEQTFAMFRRSGEEPVRPRITLCGGTWKSTRILRETYLELVAERYPGAELQIPVFEHVMVGPVRMLLDRGESRENIIRTLKSNFPGWEYVCSEY